jgi:sec-independent protein translocase protein TatA
MGSLSPIHWIIVLVVVLLLFGPARLAGVGKGLGEGIRSFKKGISDDSPDDKDRQLGEKVADKPKSENKEAKPPAEGAA